ncbi:MAG TPA: type VI secretion system tip protein TssI/VgrG [Xanthomonadaceae bacterium]|nr:type VI secretion system tip protein TssI/VgrG [Xanthomonadaceae bacterium]
MADHKFIIKGDAPAVPDLAFWNLIGHEGLSRPSVYELTVLSKRQTIDAREILGFAFDVEVEFHGPQDSGPYKRHCHGHAVRFHRVRQLGRFFEYRITLRSWFWLLTKRQNSRIFQDQDVKAIVVEVLGDSPITRFVKLDDSKVTGEHKPHRYCVQFQETDFQFISRLLEEEGIYYWFDAHDAPGTMRLSDDSLSAHDPLPVKPDLIYVPLRRSEVRSNEISEWIAGKRFQAGKFAAADSDFKKITRPLRDQKADPDVHELADLEMFEFPGDYFEPGDGEKVARLRMEEIKSTRDREFAITDWPDVAVGRRFSYRGDPDDARNGSYLIASSTFILAHRGYEGDGAPEWHHVSMRALRDMVEEDAFNAGNLDLLLDAFDRRGDQWQGRGGVSLFVNSVLPVAVSYRPQRLTPRVAMPGPQTAIVVGREGQELDVDEHGRVKVQFHWDRYGRHDEKSTCWVRVSQPWAGMSWGGYFAPRIGQEVLVEFLNGDPDRPIITGRVYNDKQRIPYKSPTHSGFKTRSTPNGGVNNFNELRFQDKMGGEQVFIHAERRMDIRVKKNKYETVQGSSQTLIGGAHALTVGDAFDLHAKSDVFARAGGKVDFSCGKALSINVGAASGQHASGPYELNARKVTIEALTSIVLKVGSSFIEVSPMGVAMVGPMIRINSGGSASGTGPLDTEDPLDAAGADTGEPGYLEKLPRGGAKPSRKRRSSNGYHAREVALQADGSFSYGGPGIRVAGGSEFVGQTLQTLASLDGTPTGHQLIDNLQSNGHTVRIVENNAVATAGGGGMCTTLTANGFPAGTNVAMPTGVEQSDGSGSDSEVNWLPGNNGQFTDANGDVHTQTDEALLGHELIHADNNARGDNLAAVPDPSDSTGNQEESRTIGINDHAGEEVSENNILRDQGQDWRRTDHDSSAVAVP